MRNAQFVEDPRPVQEGCRCILCANFSRAYLAHLFRAEELLAYRLATCHNMTFTLDFMAEIRAALRSGTFSDRLAELRAGAVPPGARASSVQPE
jgi:tRNA-guanine family transglycosylase